MATKKTANKNSARPVKTRLSAGERATEIWLTADDIHLNAEGDLYANAGATLIEKDVSVYQGGGGAKRNLPPGLYEYHFHAYNGSGNFTLHCRDANTGQPFPKDQPYKASGFEPFVYPFEV